MAYNKVGFLTGVGGNATGIGQYVHALDQAGIPAVIMANDGTTGLSDIWGLDTNVPHVMLYRVVRDGTEYYSVPDYSLPWSQAASLHWNKIRAYFPPEIIAHRDKVWIQPINEVDDQNHGSWLGFFATELAKIANAQGYKVAMFGLASGTPEPETWNTDGMWSYLRYCEDHHDMAGIALHEYDYGMVGMAHTYPWHIGRFEALFAFCSEHNISRPLTFISEWGWAYNDIPGQAQCLADVAFAAELYARYPQVMGAGLWYLGPGFGGIANKVQPLIQPVTNYTLNAVFPDPEEPMTTDEQLYALSLVEFETQKQRPGHVRYPGALGIWKRRMLNTRRVPAHNEISVTLEGKVYAYQGYYDPFGELPYEVDAWTQGKSIWTIKAPVPGGEPDSPF